MKPRVGIIILNWNGLADTLECLASVKALAYDNVETIVVDNGSDVDPTAAILAQFPAVQLIRSRENLGYAGGNNVGIRHALSHGADFVWLLNNDAVTAPDTLDRLVETARGDDRIGLVSPLICHYDRPDEIQACGGYLDRERFEFAMTRSPEEWQAKAAAGDAYLWGTALLVKRAVLDRVGFLEERYFAYAEDRQYCFRALGQGFALRLDTTARVFHKWARASGGDLNAPRKVFLLSRNNGFFWLESLRGTAKLRFLHKYLLDSIDDWVRLEQQGRTAAAQERRRATWCAVRGIAGSPESCGPIPPWAERLFFSRPGVWYRLLKGQFAEVAMAKLRKIAGRGGRS